MPSTTPQPGQMQQPRSLSASTLPRAQSAGDPMRRRSHDMARTYGFANRRIDDRQTYLESRFGWRTPVAVRMLGTQYNWIQPDTTPTGSKASIRAPSGDPARLEVVPNSSTTGPHRLHQHVGGDTRSGIFWTQRINKEKETALYARDYPNRPPDGFEFGGQPDPRKFRSASPTHAAGSKRSARGRRGGDGEGAASGGHTNAKEGRGRSKSPGFRGAWNTCYASSPTSPSMSASATLKSRFKTPTFANSTLPFRI